MADATFNRAAELDSPAWDAVAVTPSDANDLARVATRALWIGGAGSVSVNMSGAGEAIVFAGVQGLIPIRVDRVLATGTTATNIVALY